MQSAPDFAAFEATYAAGRAQVVHTALIADLETPVSAFLKLAEGRPNSFLFESVEGGSIIGRYSFLGMRPDLIWRCRSRSEEHTSELQSLMSISYAVFCLKTNNKPMNKCHA